jgi:hypothetical protein
MFTSLEKSKLAQAITPFGFYSAGALLEFRTGHRIPEDFCGFLTSSRKMQA